MDKQKFYEKDWFIWITLIFVAPLGIFLMWQQDKYKKETRIALTVIFTILFAIVVYQITSKATIVKVTQQQKVSIGQPSETKKYQNKQEVKKTLVSTKVTKESSQNSIDNEAKNYFQTVGTKTPQLGDDIAQASTALLQQDYDTMQTYCNNIVKDCNDIESLKAPTQYQDLDNQLKQACELYKNTYSNLYSKIQQNDSDWINQQTSNIDTANGIIKNITQELNSMEGK